MNAAQMAQRIIIALVRSIWRIPDVYVSACFPFLLYPLIDSFSMPPLSMRVYTLHQCLEAAVPVHVQQVIYPEYWSSYIIYWFYFPPAYETEYLWHRIPLPGMSVMQYMICCYFRTIKAIFSMLSVPGNGFYHRYGLSSAYDSIIGAPFFAICTDSRLSYKS